VDFSKDEDFGKEVVRGGEVYLDGMLRVPLRTLPPTTVLCFCGSSIPFWTRRSNSFARGAI
jgi:hypothetical protein